MGVKIHGIYSINDLNKVGDIANLWGKELFGTVKLQDSFQKILEDNKISITENNLVVFLYFDNSFSKSSEIVEDRFYDHKKFRSFANENTGKAYINVYNLTPSFSSKAVEIVIHETLHLFGAVDKYIEDRSSEDICSDKGRGDTNLDFSLPQKTADIMCGFIEHVQNKYTRGNLTDNNLVINQLTAKEIGWR